MGTASIEVSKLSLDPRIRSDVVTQYTTTDGLTHTDALDAARHQVDVDLCEIGHEWMADDTMITCGEDFAEVCKRYSDRLRTTLQRLADISAAAPVPIVPVRPGKKKGAFTRPTAPADPPPVKFR